MEGSLGDRARPTGQVFVDDKLMAAVYSTIANVLAIVFTVTLYYNYLLLHQYLRPIMFAVLCAIALHGVKSSAIGFLENVLEMDTQSEKRASLLRKMSASMLDWLLETLQHLMIFRNLWKRFETGTITVLPTAVLFIAYQFHRVRRWVTRSPGGLGVGRQEERAAPPPPRRTSETRRSTSEGAGHLPPSSPPSGRTAGGSPPAQPRITALERSMRDDDRRFSPTRTISSPVGLTAKSPTGARIVGIDERRELFSKRVGLNPKLPTAMEQPPQLQRMASKRIRSRTRKRRRDATPTHPPSVLYFRILFAAFVLYHLYHIFLVQPSIVITTLLLCMAACASMLCLGILWFFTNITRLFSGLSPVSVTEMLSLAGRSTARGYEWLAGLTGTGPYIAAVCRGVVRACFFVVDALDGSLRMAVRAAVVVLGGGSLHTMVAIIIILVFMVGVFAFTSFFTFQCLWEGQNALHTVHAFVDERVLDSGPFHDWLQQNETSELMNMYITRTLATAEDKFGEMFAQGNFSQLVSDIHTLYMLHWNKPPGGATTTGDVAVSNTSAAMLQSPIRAKLMTLHSKLVKLEIDSDLVYVVMEVYHAGVEYLKEVFIGTQKDGGQTEGLLPPNSSEWLMKIPSLLLNWMTHAGAQVMNNSFFMLSTILNYIVFVCVSLLSYGFSVLLFLSCLFYLLQSENDGISLVVNLLPVSVETRTKISSALANSVQGVFLVTFKICVFHSLFTWLTFSMAGVNFVYLSTFMSGLFSIIPFLGSWVVSLYAALELYTTGHWVSAIFMVTLHYAVSWWVDPAIYSEIPNSHPYLVGLSIISGLYVFDIEGVLIGPLLVTIPAIIYNLYLEFVKGPTDG